MLQMILLVIYVSSWNQEAEREKNMCHLEVSEWNHHLQGQIRNLWTTICIWWPNPRKKTIPWSHLYRLCSAGRWRRPGGWPKTLKDKLSFHLTNVQAPHLSFSAEHFYQDLCKYSPTFWDVYIYIYILTARSQVLETGGGWQGPTNYFNLIFVHKNVHPFSTTSVKLHLVRGEAHGDLRNQRCVICFLWPPDQLYFHCMLAPPKKIYKQIAFTQIVWRILQHKTLSVINNT